MTQVWTDGCCLGNPGPGGWATLTRDASGTETIRSGGLALTTNNRMELHAAIAAVEGLGSGRQEAVITSDSKYVVDAFRQDWIAGWKRRGWRTAAKKPVKNRDLWERLIAAAERHSVTWEWTHGHAGQRENEICDEAAKAAAEGANGPLETDTGYAAQAA